jgi:hypothetical protein
LANVASGEVGATRVSTSPGAKLVAEAIAKVAVVANAANIMFPTLAPFFWMSKVADADAATPAVPWLPGRPAAKLTIWAKT